MTQTHHIPYVVSWNITRRCNLSCKHCYIDASTAMEGELSTGEALRVVQEVSEVAAGGLLILSGGEPLLRPDLEALVHRAATLGMTVVLGTNGTLITRPWARSQVDQGLGGVGISLDSLVAARHDAFRGTDGAWKATVEGIGIARDAGLDVQLQMTLTRENLSELPRVAHFAREAGARALSVFFLVCTGRGQELVDLNPEEYEDAIRVLISYRESGILVRPRCAPTWRRAVAQARPDSILLQTDAGRCMAGKSYCRITPDGKVTPCPYMPVVVGSLREASFGTIWRSAALFKVLREPDLKGRCGVCEYRELCGGCRARSLALNGDIEGEDPWCTYVPGTDARRETAEAPALEWAADAEKRLESVPFFVRQVVRSAVEAYGRRKGVSIVTAELLQEARNTLVRPRSADEGRAPVQSIDSLKGPRIGDSPRKPTTIGKE